MNALEHIRKAEELLEQSADTLDWSDAHSQELLARAQVHATLALAAAVPGSTPASTTPVDERYRPQVGDTVDVTITGATVVETPGWHDDGIGGWYAITYPHPSGDGMEYASVNADSGSVTIRPAATS